MHDLTYDRTTNLTGPIHSLPSSVLADARVLQPQLGSAWTQPANAPAVPRLADVLTAVGGRAVLCVEAKRDADYPAVMRLIEQHRLTDSVIVKAFHASRRIAQAKLAGYPVFCYLAANDVSADSIAAAVSASNSPVAFAAFAS
jgi:glycerophosphoryl diester phosphodiesterase